MGVDVEVLMHIWRERRSCIALVKMTSKDQQLIPHSQLIVSATTLVLATKYLERIWGFKELIRFSLITVVVSNVIAFGFSWIAYTILGQEDYM